MKIQRLDIAQQRAQIQIHSERGKLKIKSSTRGMQVKSSSPQMSVDQQMGKVNLDYSGIKESTSRLNIFDMQERFAAAAKQDAQDGIERIVEDGDYVAQQPNPGNLRGSLELERMLEVQTPSFGGSDSIVPEAAVTMDGTAGTCDIQWTPGKFEICWEDYQRPSVTLEPSPSVDISVAKEAKIKCELVEKQISLEPGAVIDVSA